MLFCSHFLLILITLLKDVHTTRKTCSGFRRNPAFDNLALNTSTFRIQVRNEIQHPMCIQRCFQHGSDCAGVLVNEHLQLCWLLKCFLTERFLQRGLLTVSSGWKYYLEENSRLIQITFRCLEKNVHPDCGIKQPLSCLFLSIRQHICGQFPPVLEPFALKSRGYPHLTKRGT